MASRLDADGVRVLARIGDGGATGIEATRGERAATLAAWRAPAPPGLALVHASWLDAALAELPARAREAVAGDRVDDIDVWLARWACADIPPMDHVPPDPLGWLAAIGAEQLAFALGDAAARADSQLVRDAAARLVPSRMGSRRAAIARCRVDADDDLRFARIGAREIAPRLDAVAARRLVLRLPRPLGIAIAAELRAHARDPLADAPMLADHG